MRSTTFSPVVLALAALIGLGGLTGVARAADFAPAVDHGGSTFPVALALTDLDGDGATDIVTAENSDSGLTHSQTGVLLGGGDGSFTAPTEYVTGDGTYGVATGDFDRDGHRDVAVAEYGTDAIGILRGRGDGTLEPETQLPVGTAADDVVAGDLDRDGLTDLVSMDNNGQTVTVLRGHGDGTFDADRSFWVGRYPQRGAIADIDGDGRPDVAVSLDSDAVAVLWGTGGGLLSKPTVVHLAALDGNGPRGIALADMNGDGHPDVVADGGTSIAVLDGRTDHTLGAARTYAAYPDIGGDGEALGLTVADVNGDGNEDVAVTNNGTESGSGNHPGDLAVLHGDGHGHLGPAEGYDIPPTEHDPFTDEIGAGPNNVAAGDFDGDGRPDLAVTHTLFNHDSGGVAILRNVGTWTPVVRPPATPSHPAPKPAAAPTKPAQVKPHAPADTVATKRPATKRPAVKHPAVALHLRSLKIRGSRVSAVITHSRAAHGRVTVALRRLGAPQWRHLTGSERSSFRLRFRHAPGRFVLRVRFTGTLAHRHRMVQATHRLALRAR